MSLNLNEKQILPDGIHESNLDGVRDRFGSFQRTDRRTKLFAKLSEYIDELRLADLAEAVIVDGSFIMGCIDEPNDIDLILVLRETWDMTEDLRPFQYNLVSKRDVKRKYPFDLKAVRANSPEEAEWVMFFSKINTKWYDEYGFEPGSTKGLVRIAI